MATQESRSMVSETSICNQALAAVGANRIDSLEDRITEAEWCRDNYPFIRDAVLEERMWTFATARAVSGPVTDQDDWGQLYKHQLPMDWMKCFRVYCRITNTHREPSVGWEREGRFILAREPTIYMWGVKRIVDTGQYSQQFAQCLFSRLAAEMAIPFAENRQLQADYWKLYQAKLADAATRDGQQMDNEEIVSDSLITARGRVY